MMYLDTPKSWDSYKPQPDLYHKPKAGELVEVYQCYVCHHDTPNDYHVCGVCMSGTLNYTINLDVVHCFNRVLRCDQ